jgi:hypothetical protein
MIAAKASQPMPGEPYRLMSYFFFLTMIGAGVLWRDWYVSMRFVRCIYRTHALISYGIQNN